MQVDAFFLCGSDRFFAGVSLIHEGQLHRLTRHVLHFLGQRTHLRAFLLVGRRDLGCQQITQRIDRHVHLAALLALVPAVTCPGPALGVTGSE